VGTTLTREGPAVARLADLKDPGQRELAGKWTPADILSRLSTEELRHRAAYACGVKQRATAQQGEHAIFLHAHARAVLGSEPAAEHVIEQGRLKRLAESAPSTELRGAWLQGRRQHSEGHQYPPGLLGAVDKRLLGQPVIGDPGLAAVAEACVNRVKAAREHRN